MAKDRSMLLQHHTVFDGWRSLSGGVHGTCWFAMLAGGINDTNIVISMFSFNFLWIFADAS